MSNDTQASHEEDTWAGLGLGDEPGTDGGVNGPHGGGDLLSDRAEGGGYGGDDGHHDIGGEAGVVDVEEAPKKPKSKVGIYAAVAVAGVIALAIVWAIIGKMMAVMSPNKGADGVVSSAEIKPLDSGQTTAIPGGLAGQDHGAAPQEQILLDSNAQVPVASASSPAALQVGAAPAVPTTVGGTMPGAAPSSAPVASAVAAAPAAACLVVDTSAKDREIAGLKSSLGTANDRIRELEAKQQSKPAAKPVAKAANKSSQNKIVRGKPADVKVDVKEAAAPAAALAATPDAEKSAPLPAYRLYAVYPNTGEYKAAHLVDPAGKNEVVRVGSKLRNGATVLKIDADAWRVQTTDGDIR